MYQSATASESTSKNGGEREKMYKCRSPTADLNAALYFSGFNPRPFQESCNWIIEIGEWKNHKCCRFLKTDKNGTDNHLACL
jgi:hypothetical protein